MKKKICLNDLIYPFKCQKLKVKVLLSILENTKIKTSDLILIGTIVISEEFSPCPLYRDSIPVCWKLNCISTKYLHLWYSWAKPQKGYSLVTCFLSNNSFKLSCTWERRLLVSSIQTLRSALGLSKTPSITDILRLRSHSVAELSCRLMFGSIDFLCISSWTVWIAFLCVCNECSFSIARLTRCRKVSANQIILYYTLFIRTYFIRI